MAARVARLLLFLLLPFATPLAPSASQQQPSRRDVLGAGLRTSAAAAAVPAAFPAPASSATGDPKFNVGDSLSAKLQQRDLSVLKTPLFNLAPSQQVFPPWFEGGVFGAVRCGVAWCGVGCLLPLSTP